VSHRKPILHSSLELLGIETPGLRVNGSKKEGQGLTAPAILCPLSFREIALADIHHGASLCAPDPQNPRPTAGIAIGAPIRGRTGRSLASLPTWACARSQREANGYSPGPRSSAPIGGWAVPERRGVRYYGDVARRPIISCASAFSLDSLPLPCAGLCYPPPADTLCLYTLAAWFRFLTPNVL
jgi:hypothetical protein